MTEGTAGAFAVCIVHHRDPEAVARLLRDMRDWDEQPVEVRVVDNSRDLPGGLAQVAADSGVPRVVIETSRTNVGYGPAGNVGIRAARLAGLPYLLMLTQDARLDPQAARLLRACLDDEPDVSVAAPVLGLASRPHLVFSAGGRLTRHARARHLFQGEPIADVPSPGRHDVAWADGACLMLRVDDVCSVGGIPEEYFLYVEEVDLMHALRRRGRRVAVVRAARAWQEPGAFPAYLKYRNHVHLVRKYPGDFRPWPWRTALLRDAVRRRSVAYVAWALRGVHDARRGRMGPPPQRLLGG